METWDELRELMEEPPGGHNHGRARAMSGDWESVEQVDYIMQTRKRYADARKHGTAYTYMKLRCRCEQCRAWQSLRMRAYRLGLATSTGPIREETEASALEAAGWSIGPDGWHPPPCRVWPDDYRGFGSNVRPPRQP